MKLKKSFLLASIFTLLPTLGNNVFCATASENPLSLEGVELLKALKPGLDLSVSEEQYLNANSSLYSINYDRITTESYKVGKSGDVFYVEFNNLSSEFKPVEVLIGSKSFKETLRKDDKSIFILNDVDSLDGASVVYESEVLVDKNIANNVLNAAYNARANEIEVREQNKLKNEWKTYLDYKEAKTIFDEKNEKYQNYLLLKEKYEKDLLAYQNYQDLMNNYAENVEKYNKYVEDLAYYNSHIEQNKKDVERYNNYIEPMKHQLDVMDIIFTGFGSLKRTLSSFIEGDTVTSVLQRRDDLVGVLGVDGDCVQRAGQATEAIRTIISEYKSETTNKGKYTYYQRNYTKRIKPNFIKLTQCLETFLRNDKVKGVIKDEGKLDKYTLLIAELIYLCCGLSDTPVVCYDAAYKGVPKDNSRYYELDENTLINGQKYSEILNAQLLDTTKTSVPVSDSYPDEEVKPLVKPEEVVNPGDVVPVLEPVAPAVVENPGTKPEEVIKPAKNQPESLILEEEDESLNSLIDDQSLVFRKEFSEDQLVKVRQSKPLDYSVIDTSTVLASFNVNWYLEGEDAPFETTNGYIGFMPELKNKPTKKDVVINGLHYSYEIENYYVDDHTLSIDDSLSGEDINVVVKFEKVRTYLVNFIVDGSSVNSYYSKLNETIKFDGETPTIPETNYCKYDFEGWKIGGEFVELSTYEIKGDTNVIASFNKTLKYSVTFETKTDSKTSTYYAGETPDSSVVDTSDYHDVNYYYEFDGFDKEIAPVSGNKNSITYSAKYKDGKKIISNANISLNFDGCMLIHVDENQTKIEISKLIEILEKDNNYPEIKIFFGSDIVSFGLSGVTKLISENAKTIEFKKELKGEVNTDFTLEVVNSSNTKIDSSKINANVTLYNLKNVKRLHTFINEVDSHDVLKAEQNSIQFNVKINQLISLIPIYILTFDQFSSATFKINGEVAHAGEGISKFAGEKIDITALGDGDVSLYAINFTTGEKIDINEGEFVMPDGDVKICATVLKSNYLVTFKVDGIVYKTYSTSSKDKINLPVNIDKANDSDAVYTFVGWAIEGTDEIIDSNVLLVDQDYVLVAVFKRVENDLSNIKQKESLGRIAALSGLGILVAAFIGAILGVSLKKKKSM